MKTQGFRRRPRVLLAAASAAAAALFAGSAVSSSTAAARATASIPGVVDINTNLRYESAAAAGTGIVLTSSGEVLTNNHVIRGATTIRVTDTSSGHSYPATVAGYDPTADIALLRLKGASHLKTVTLGRSSTVKVGQLVTAVGNAGGTGGAPLVTRGRVTRLNRSITVSDSGETQRLTQLIETNASLQPGDSGGPLLNASGRVIGINTAASVRFAFQTGSSAGFATPIDRAVAVVKQIESGRSSGTVHVGPTAFLGVGVAAAGGEGSAGVVITGVVDGSPAATAGLAIGDVITSFDGQTISSPATLRTLVLGRAPGASVQLAWVAQSDGGTRSANVRLATGPPQ